MNQAEQNRAKKRIGIAMRRFLLGTFPAHKYEMTFGCDRDFLRAFLEFQFQEWMTWENFTERWQIGHVLPLAAFDQTDPKQIRLCWNWVNTRPVFLGNTAISSGHARDILDWRKTHFPNNPAVDLLLQRAVEISEREEPDFRDWTAFTAKNSYHVVWETEEDDGHGHIREPDGEGEGCSGVSERSV